MEKTVKERFLTLDVFRGLTIFLMIIVNTQGGGSVPYKQMMHADWNGFTLTDLVFPSFLFAVGNAMPFAFAKFDKMPERAVVLKILKRGLLIFVIGFLLGWYATMRFGYWHISFVDADHVRIMAVLQRIALCYVIAALMARFLPFRWLMIAAIVMLFIYWFLLNQFGDYTITGNAVRRLDLRLLGINHLYRERGIVFDPEGLLSTIPAVVNVITGYLAGAYIRDKGKNYECLAMLALSGIACIVVGLWWNLMLPLNKKLWTSSYVVFTSGLDLVILAFLFYWIELLQFKKGLGLFLAFGKNPLFIYILSNLFLFLLILPVQNNMILIDWVSINVFQKLIPGPMGCLLFALAFTLLMGLFAWLMNKRKIYIRV